MTYRWRNWGTEQPRDLPKDAAAACSRAVSLSPSTPLICLCLSLNSHHLQWSLLDPLLWKTLHRSVTRNGFCASGTHLLAAGDTSSLGQGLACVCTSPSTVGSRVCNSSSQVLHGIQQQQPLVQHHLSQANAKLLVRSMRKACHPEPTVCIRGDDTCLLCYYMAEPGSVPWRFTGRQGALGKSHIFY